MSKASHRPATATRLPGLIRDLAGGLKQQMFFWGMDVAHAGGNLLVEQGFTREPSAGTSHYKLPWQGGRIELHGSSAGWYPPGASGGFLYLRPAGRCRVWLGESAPVPGEWPVAQMNSDDCRGVYEAALPFIDWWLASEEWIARRKGHAYRLGCFRHFKRLPRSRPWLLPPLDRNWLRGFRDDPGSLPRVSRFEGK